jgi:hypothetical protein
MSAAVNGDTVSISIEESFTNLIQVVTTLIENRDDSAFR